MKLLFWLTLLAGEFAAREIQRGIFE